MVPRFLRHLALPIALIASAAQLWPDAAAAFTPAEAKAPMTVTLVRSDAASCGADCPEWLALTGRIGFETPALLSAALARLRGRKMPVLLDSPGGESTAGLAMGRMIRAAGLDTVVAATVLTRCFDGDAACSDRLRAGVRPGHISSFTPPACASACVLVLAGGANRVVPWDAFVGVHQAKRRMIFHPVMNRFLVLKRRIGDRVVEVERRLVSSRPMTTRIVESAAPASVYAAFDRYLRDMGIGEAIMPLMRATPPSGIHWMSRHELDETRIATDATDAATLVDREATAQAEADAAAAARRSARAQAAALHPVAAPASLTLDDGRRSTGTVTWHIDATSRDVPVLVGDWQVPERHIGGSVEIVPETVAGSPWSFTLSAHFLSKAAPDDAVVLGLNPPRICDLSLCWQEFRDEPIRDGASGTFHVVRTWRGDLLMQLHHDDWLVFDVRTEDGRGQVALTLTSPDGHAVDLWEKLCCGFAATDDPWTAPATPLPALPAAPQPFLISGFAPLTARSDGGPKVHALGAVALFGGKPEDRSDWPERLQGSAVWTTADSPGLPPRPGQEVLLGDVDLPALQFHLRLHVKRSLAGVLGRLTVEIRATSADDARFGPPDRLTVPTILDRHGHPLLLADSVTAFRWEGGYEVAFDIPETGPIAGALQLAFRDARQRRITVAVPFEPATAALLQAAARGDDSGGS